MKKDSYSLNIKTLHKLQQKIKNYKKRKSSIVNQMSNSVLNQKKNEKYSIKLIYI